MRRKLAGSGASIAFFRTIRSLPKSRSRSCCNAGQPRVRLSIMPLSANDWHAPWPRPNVTVIPASRRHARTRVHSSKSRSNGAGPISTARKKSAFSWILPGHIHPHAHHYARSLFIRCWCWRCRGCRTPCPTGRVGFERPRNRESPGHFEGLPTLGGLGVNGAVCRRSASR